MSGAFQGITKSTVAPAATDRGTKIVKGGEGMDKSAFLKILSAELSNQDPDNAKDSTQYVTQMAQFAGLEQMSNLNTTMLMSSANGLIGKSILLNQADPNGEQYSGTVRAVFKSGSNIKLKVEVPHDNGTTELKDFDYSDVASTIETAGSSLNTLNSNMSFLLATSLMGKKVQIADSSTTDYTKYSGTVKSVYRDGNNTKIAVEVEDGNGVKTTKNFPYEDITSVDAP